jgi:3,4-dihydroxy 2-butanone 4-phosphate synthase
MMADTLKKAIEKLRNGEIVMIYDADGREKETDLVIASQFVTMGHIKKMRIEAGGLICITAHEDIWNKLELPYLTDLFRSVDAQYKVLKELKPNDIPYDAKSSFSLTINHRKTFTGISDYDRALTISEFARTVDETKDMDRKKAQETFGKRFRSPGHIHILNASEGLLSKRVGHTELATAMTIGAGLTPTATICEMIGEDGRSLSKTDAIKYGERNDYIFLEGREIVEWWNKSKGVL